MEFCLIPGLALSVILLPEAGQTVGGISNTKIVGPSTDTVPSGAVEFEPTFGFSSARKGLDDKGKGFSLGGRRSAQEIGARLTTGILENLEAGVSFRIESSEDASVVPAEKDTGIGDLEAGFKFRFWEPSDVLHVALQGGITFPTSSQTSAFLGEGGLIFTYYANEKISVDADVSIGGSTASASQPNGPRWMVAWDVAAGYKAIDNLTLVCEVNALHQSPPGGPPERSIALTPGFTWAPNDRGLVIIGFPIVLPRVSKNTDRSVGIVGALTLVFE